MTPPSARRSALSILLIPVLLPAVWWLRFGRVDGFCIAFTVFLVLLAVAVEFLPRAEPATDVAPPPGPSRLDVLGPVWLLSIPFAPFVSWSLTSVFDVTRENYRLLLGIRAFLCVVVPVVSALSLLRFVRRGVAGIALLILFLGTAFPVATALGSAYDVLRGPTWESVTIVGFEDVDFRTQAGTRVHQEHTFVKLGDGRTLTHADAVALERGPAKLLVLRGFDRVLAAEQ